MTFISRGEVYNGPLTDCDLDALIDARLAICMHRSNWPTSVANWPTSVASLIADAFAAAAGLLPELPAAAGTPNETRNE